MNEKKSQERSRVIGMDLHPSCFSASAFLGKNVQTAIRLWTHDKVELQSLEAWVKHYLIAGDIVVIEAGSNSFEICERLRELRIRAVVLESCSVGRIGDAYLKNDEIDSVKIAKVYLSGLAKEVWQPDTVCRERREILACYQRSTRDATRMQNRLTSWCTEHGLRRPKGMSWKSPKAESWMLRQHTWSPAQRLLVSSMFADLRHAKAQQAALKQHIAAEVTADPALSRLLQICGIRHITAFALVAAIGDISRFRNAKKLVAYIGLNPRVNESGISRKSSSLAHNGRKDVRHLLVQGAQAVLRQDPARNRLARWGQALTFRKNKAVAAIAVARKLLTAVWYLLSGFKPAIKEVTRQITIKVGKICTDLGTDQLARLGYASRKDYIQRFSELIVQPA